MIVCLTSNISCTSREIIRRQYYYFPARDVVCEWQQSDIVYVYKHAARSSCCHSRGRLELENSESFRLRRCIIFRNTIVRSIGEKWTICCARNIEYWLCIYFQMIILYWASLTRLARSLKLNRWKYHWLKQWHKTSLKNQ